MMILFRASINWYGVKVGGGGGKGGRAREDKVEF